MRVKFRALNGGLTTRGSREATTLPILRAFQVLQMKAKVGQDSFSSCTPLRSGGRGFVKPVVSSRFALRCALHLLGFALLCHGCPA